MSSEDESRKRIIHRPIPGAKRTFHLFLRQLEPTVCLHVLVSVSVSSLVASVQGLNPIKHLPSLFWTTKLPVLLHFLASGGARESGGCRDVREKLLKLSNNCSGLPAGPGLTPVSSSEGSVESRRITVQSLCLLRVLCRPLVAWRLSAVCGARGL